MRRKSLKGCKVLVTEVTITRTILILIIMMTIICRLFI